MNNKLFITIFFIASLMITNNLADWIVNGSNFYNVSMNSTMNGTYIIPSTNRTVNPKLASRMKSSGSEINPDSSTSQRQRRKQKSDTTRNPNTDTSHDENNSYGSNIEGYSRKNKTEILSDLLDKIKDLIMLLAAK